MPDNDVANCRQEQYLQRLFGLQFLFELEIIVQFALLDLVDEIRGDIRMQFHQLLLLHEAFQ